MTCLACGSSSFSPLHEEVRDFEHGLPGRVSFAICSDCGWVVQTPRATRESLQSAYPADYRAHASGRGASGQAVLLRQLKQIQANLLVSKLLPWLPPDRNAPILDVGCGNGHLLFALRAKGYQRLAGLDQNPALSRDFDGTNIQYQSRDLEAEEDLGGTYAAIVMVNVIEHFVDPGKILSLARRSLRPGGRIIIVTPNARSWSHQVFGRFWSGLHAPRHTQIFNPSNFARWADNLQLLQIHSAALTDPGSWAISCQNWISSLRPRTGAHARGTAWYSIALLPVWHLLAASERLADRSSSFLSVLSPTTDPVGSRTEANHRHGHSA